MKILNCFDSHVHWEKSGESGSYLCLKKLTKPEDVAHLRVEPHNFKGEWLIGFGWDQNLWVEKKLPVRQSLDKVFPDIPVHFIRSDMHASWVNSKALELMGILNKTSHELSDPEGGKIFRDKNDHPTGVLIDTAREFVFNVIPKANIADKKKYLLIGMDNFNRQGFTHIRDMTCTQAQWQAARQLEDEQSLSLAVEEFFFHPNAEDYALSIHAALEARRDERKLLKAKGIKIFLDGALGSEGAYLSEPYLTGTGQGLLIIRRELLQEIIRKSWEANLIPAIHAIGDQAVHEIVEAAEFLKNKKNQQGPIHIEHAQLVRAETIKKMRELEVTCFFQPCHWLSDRHWLKNKIGPLFYNAFPWASMEENNIPFFFGSDSPIETACLYANKTAIEDASRNEIKPPKKEWHHYHSHPDPLWLKETYSVFKDGCAKEVWFEGQNLMKV